MEAEDLLLRERYRLVRIIGEGGMGKVWLAEDTLNGQHVAVKQLHTSITRDETEFKRFEREAGLLRQLEHPNIIRIVDFFEERRRHYLVMAFMPGGSLFRALRMEGPFSPERVRYIGLKLCSALARAHSLGVIHRDLKPENVLLDADGAPVLTDFGLARIKGGTPLTREGWIVGSLTRVSPEECKGQKADERSDIWGLGVMFYELLTGESPFERRNTQATISAIFNEPPPPLEDFRLDLPPEMTDLVYRMLEKDPAKRFGSVQEVAAALEQVPVTPAPSPPAEAAKEKAATPPPPGRWPRYLPLVLAGLIALVVLAVVLVALARP